MLANEPIIAFLATSDAVKARNFYQNMLGLAMVEESEYALVFDALGIELRLQKMPETRPQPHTALGWQVSDIDKRVAELSAVGVDFIRYETMEQDEHNIWASPSGARIAWFKDPDGNVLSLTQPA